MGEKGAKLNEKSTLKANQLIDRLAGIDGVSSRKMFGGHGIFYRDKMFAMVNSKGECYFKLGDANKADFESYKAPRHSKMPYGLIPEAVFEDRELLMLWAKKAIAPLNT